MAFRENSHSRGPAALNTPPTRTSWTDTRSVPSCPPGGPAWSTSRVRTEYSSCPEQRHYTLEVESRGKPTEVKEVSFKLIHGICPDKIYINKFNNQLQRRCKLMELNWGHKFWAIEVVQKKKKITKNLFWNWKRKCLKLKESLKLKYRPEPDFSFICFQFQNFLQFQYNFSIIFFSFEQTFWS